MIAQLESRAVIRDGRGARGGIIRCKQKRIKGKEGWRREQMGQWT